MMACPPGEEKRQVFVQVRGDNMLLRYNSKLPIVVYAPTGFEVRYRIWAAGEEIKKAVVE
jgi:ecotin